MTSPEDRPPHEPTPDRPVPDEPGGKAVPSRVPPNAEPSEERAPWAPPSGYGSEQAQHTQYTQQAQHTQYTQQAQHTQYSQQAQHSQYTQQAGNAPHPQQNGWAQQNQAMHPWPAAPAWQLPPPPPRVTKAPDGSRYHELGRNGRGGKYGWLGELLLFPVLLVAVVGVVYVTAMALAEVFDAGTGDPDSLETFRDPLAELALGLVVLAVGIPVVLFSARFIGKRPAGVSLSVAGRLRIGWLLRCCAVAFPLMALHIGLLILWTTLSGDGSEEVTGEGDTGFPGWPYFLLSVVVLLALVPLQAAAEEFVFRGWLVQTLCRVVRSPWPGVAVASVLFSLAHGFGQWSGFLLLLWSAAWWGWLTIRTGGLEGAIAIHTANNVIAFLLAAAIGALADDSTAADMPWQGLVMELVFAPVYCLLIARLAERKGIADRSAGTGTQAEPTV